MTRARETRTGFGTPRSGVHRLVADAQPPARIGQYRIVGELGRGGMGVVYEAEHELLGRRVALKTLEPAQDLPGRRARFLDEARTGARLRHPAVASVVDAGEDQGRVYLVMDLVRGESLEARLRRGPLAPFEALTLLAPVIDALAAAHRERIVHRDVKPGNILVDGDGRALLADFGLACDLFSTRERAPADRPLGTLAYMAPEQLRGEAALPAADVWALGVTLFEALTGQLPWGEPSANLDVFARAQEHPPRSLRALAPAVPEGLERVVLRCLAPRPDERFADAGELLAALESLRPWSLPAPATPEAAPDAAASGRARLRARLAAAAGVLAGFVAGATGAHVAARLTRETRAAAPPPPASRPAT